MKEVEKYRQYAAECRRMAANAPEKDRQALLDIAEAWDKQALIAEAADKRRR